MTAKLSARINTFFFACTNLLIASEHAYAQDDAMLVVIDAIVVTAQKREENLQEIPFSVSAISGETLKSMGALSHEEIAATIPGFAMTSYTPTQPQFFIRGIGSTGTSAGEDTSVGIFVDDVYAGRSGVQGGKFLDLERVEVLRGPQGTLYGRNVAGGAINVISKKPGPVAEGYVEGTYGRYDRTDIRGAIGGPITGKTLQGRLAVAYDARDGYITNDTTGSDSLREYDNLNARGHLLFDLSYNAQLLLSADYFNADELGLASREAIVTSVPVLGAGFIPLATPSSSIRTTELAADGDSQREFYGLSARLDIETPIGTLTSITAFRASDYDVFEDVTAYGLPLLGQDENTDQWSQEVRLTSTGSLLEWTAGVYFLTEDIDRLDITQSSGPDPEMVLFPDRAEYSQDAETRSYAVFGQATYPVFDRLNITLGGRYTVDEKDFAMDASGVSTLTGVLPEGPFSVDEDDTFKEFTGKLSLAYQFGDDALAYFTFSQGYKSGGFNGVSTIADDARSPFEPETADTFEIGLRSEWLDNRLRLNLAAFFTDYQDLQVFQIRDAGTQFISNAAEAQIQGFELEAVATPLDGLTLGFTYGYLDSEYDKFVSAENMEDLSGNSLTRSPENTFSFSAEYKMALGTAGELLVRADYSYQDELFITPENRPLDTIDSYDLLNARITYQTASNISISVFGKNLADEEYLMHSFDADPFVRNNIGSAVFADPRTWGITVGYKF
ncbi:MAG: TonB-dependent receptor [Pseudomonadales bacterium]